MQKIFCLPPVTETENPPRIVNLSEPQNLHLIGFFLSRLPVEDDDVDDMLIYHIPLALAIIVINASILLFIYYLQLLIYFNQLINKKERNENLA